MQSKPTHAIARWIRVRRVAWLERKADEIEREHAGSPAALYARGEANRMRRKANALRGS